ncbi:hypothetical protein [Flavobacterium selenitireducens]|uniref:hypothetical protein n=1 Tax=Flavobacterium selenitireducens TaxID=2722704 RepID=UPI00168BF634|nr:hypothetical protein [Flavobacterium selenitireducens]MBD3582999.1 hypothetical protein [Flavobacterium selenitireducens]
MKKLFLIATFGLLAASCGDDDSGASGKVPTQIVMTGDDPQFNNVYTFAYENRRLKQITRTGAQDVTYVLNYGNSKKPQSVAVTGDLEATVLFTYDDRNRLIRSVVGGNSIDILYLEGNAFVISNVTEGSLTDDGDLGTLGVTQFTYENSKKGAFANVKGADALMLAVIETNMPYYASKKPVTGVINTEDEDLSRHVAQTYDDDGYPIVSEISGNAEFTMSFTYD